MKQKQKADLPCQTMLTIMFLSGQTRNWSITIARQNLGKDLSSPAMDPPNLNGGWYKIFSTWNPDMGTQ